MFFAAIQNERDKLNVERLYYQYRKLMYREAVLISDNAQDAEDAVSESFIRIIRNLHKIDENNCPRTRAFLVIICRNVAIDGLKKKRHTTEYDDETYEQQNGGSNLDDIIISKETFARAKEAIQSLDTKYQDVLLLKRVYGFSREEIADMFGITVETVKKRLVRANQMILKQLEKEGIRYGRK